MSDNGWDEYRLLVEQHIEQHIIEQAENKQCHSNINQKLDTVLIEIAKTNGRDAVLRVVFNSVWGIIGGAIIMLIGHFIKK